MGFGITGWRWPARDSSDGGIWDRVLVRLDRRHGWLHVGDGLGWFGSECGAGLDALWSIAILTV